MVFLIEYRNKKIKKIVKFGSRGVRNAFCKILRDIVGRYKNEIVNTIPTTESTHNNKWIIKRGKHLIYSIQGFEVVYNLDTNTCDVRVGVFEYKDGKRIYKWKLINKMDKKTAMDSLEKLVEMLSNIPYKSDYERRIKTYVKIYKSLPDVIRDKEKFYSESDLCSMLNNVVNKYQNEYNKLLRERVHRLSRHMNRWYRGCSDLIPCIECKTGRYLVRYYNNKCFLYKVSGTMIGKRIKSIIGHEYNMIVKSLEAELKSIRIYKKSEEIKLKNKNDMKKDLYKILNNFRNKIDGAKKEIVYKKTTTPETTHKVVKKPIEKTRDDIYYNKLKNLLLKKYPFFGESKYAKMILHKVINRIRIVDKTEFITDPYIRLKYKILISELSMPYETCIDIIKALKHIGFETEKCGYSKHRKRFEWGIETVHKYYCLFGPETPSSKYVLKQLRQ